MEPDEHEVLILTVAQKWELYKSALKIKKKELDDECAIYRRYPSSYPRYKKEVRLNRGGKWDTFWEGRFFDYRTTKMKEESKELQKKFGLEEHHCPDWAKVEASKPPLDEPRNTYIDRRSIYVDRRPRQTFRGSMRGGSSGRRRSDRGRRSNDRQDRRYQY